MIIRGLKWCSLDGGWGEDWSQVEFLDNGKQRFITVPRFDQEWVIVQSDEDIIDLVTEDEYNPGEHEVIDGEFPEVLPDIIRSPYCADIAFAIQLPLYGPPPNVNDSLHNSFAKGHLPLQRISPLQCWCSNIRQVF